MQNTYLPLAELIHHCDAGVKIKQKNIHVVASRAVNGENVLATCTLRLPALQW